MESKRAIHMKISIFAAVSTAAFISFGQLAHADTTLLFEDNLAPSSPYPSTNPLNTIDFLPGTEFRVILNGFVSGGGMKSIIGASNPTGGAAPTPVGWPFTTWTFDDNNILSGTLNSPNTPGATIPTKGGFTSAAPAGDIGMAQNALFLGSPFGFLATTAGSLAGNAYGPAQLTFTSGSNFNIRVGVTEAQWANGVFTIGKGQGGVDFKGAISTDNHSFRIVSETEILPDDDSLGFAGQVTQWDLVGKINSDPAVLLSKYSTDTTTPKTILVTDIATDRENDIVTITTPTPTISGTAAGTVSCTATDCTYTPSGSTGIDTFTVTVADDFATIPGSTDIMITVTVSGNPVANDDNPTNNPGTIIAQNSSDNSINLIGNDVAPSGQLIDPDTINILSGPSNGSITVPNDGSGTVLYTPDTDFSGIDSFAYEVSDNQPLTTNAATVDIEVHCTADACSPSGTITPAAGFATIRLTESELISSGVSPDDGVGGVASSCNPDCFSFTTPATGQATVVLTLSGPIQAESKYRKVDATGTTWRAFDTSAGDKIMSAPGSLGFCPPPEDPAYNEGLLEGSYCVQLIIKDAANGGLNDNDLIAGQVTDPGGIGTGSPAPIVLPGQSLSGGLGCSIGSREISISKRADWMLLIAFLSLLGWRFRRNF